MKLCTRCKRWHPDDRTQLCRLEWPDDRDPLLKRLREPFEQRVEEACLCAPCLLAALVKGVVAALHPPVASLEIFLRKERTDADTHRQAAKKSPAIVPQEQ